MCQFIPEAIAEWLKNPDPYGKGNNHRARAKRLRQYAYASFENSERLGKAWNTLEESAKDKESLVSMFLLWPDIPVVQPYTAFYGKRAVDHGEEKERYQKLSDKVSDVIALLRPEPLCQLLADIPGDEAGWSAIRSYNAMNFGATRTGLAAIRRLLDAADPKNKYLTKQPYSSDAAFQTYIIQLAQLNRYLKKPRYQAIATIANANYSPRSVTADAIRKIYYSVSPETSAASEAIRK